MILTKAWIFVNAVVFIGIGVLSLVRPNSVAAAIDFVMQGPAALPEFMANYGGLLIAIGIILILGTFKLGTVPVLVGMVIMYACYASARSVGLLINGSIDKTSLIYISYEITCGLISAVLLLRS